MASYYSEYDISGFNRGVDLLRRGKASEAISTLQDDLRMWMEMEMSRGGNEENIPPSSAPTISQLSSISSGDKKKIFESVPFPDEGELVDAPITSFPFLWYCRAIAIPSEEESSAVSTDLVPIVLLYNLGVAHQLEALQLEAVAELEPARTGGMTALHMFIAALRGLEAVRCKWQDQGFAVDVLPTAGDTVEERDRSGFVFLHMAVVNNLMYFYSLVNNMEGMKTSLAVLGEMVARVSPDLSDAYEEDVQFFRWNAMLSTMGGSLSVAPAA